MVDVLTLGQGRVGSLSLGDGGLLMSEHTVITNAQMLAIRATPITVAPAPGSGKMIIPFIGALTFDRTAAYTESGDNLQLKYSSSSGTAASASIETTAFLTAAGDAAVIIQRPSGGTILTNFLSNEPIVLHNIGTAEFGGGDAANVVHCHLLYYIIDTKLV